MPRTNPQDAPPVRILPNPVARFYQGGEGIARFRGRPSANVAPEDWVGSTTESWDPRSERRGEGLGSVMVESGAARLIDVIRADPAAWLGHAQAARTGFSPAILVKLLDTAMRLPVHCHPSRSFAQAVLASPFGKAECWVILGTQGETGTVHLGFCETISRGTLREWIDEQEVGALLNALCQVSVRAGDVLFVPPGVPHSIGPGIFMVEVQEPTDFSIVAERQGFPIREDDARLGVDWDVMIDVFDRRGLERLELDALRQAPTVTHSTPTITRTELLGSDASEYFRIERARITDSSALPSSGFAILLVTVGEGMIRAGSHRLAASKGDAFAIPAACSDQLSVDGNVELLLCRPAEPGRLPIMSHMGGDAMPVH